MTRMYSKLCYFEFVLYVTENAASFCCAVSAMKFQTSSWIYMLLVHIFTILYPFQNLVYQFVEVKICKWIWYSLQTRSVIKVVKSYVKQTSGMDDKSLQDCSVLHMLTFHCVTFCFLSNPWYYHDSVFIVMYFDSYQATRIL